MAEAPIMGVVGVITPKLKQKAMIARAFKVRLIVTGLLFINISREASSNNDEALNVSDYSTLSAGGLTDERERMA
jgi:hypothetical protein